MKQLQAQPLCGIEEHEIIDLWPGSRTTIHLFFQETMGIGMPVVFAPVGLFADEETPELAAYPRVLALGLVSMV